MSSRAYIQHTVSSSGAPSQSVGDEVFDPSTNKLYKYLAVDGKSVLRVEQLTANSTVSASNIAGVLSTSVRINPRTIVVSTSPTITPLIDIVDMHVVTALSTAATITIPSGTPTDGQRLTIRIKDNGVAQNLTWVTTAGGYRVVGTVLPTVTVASKILYIGCIYNQAENFWDVTAVAQQV